MQPIELALVAVVSYLWGSLSPAQWAAWRAARKDLRDVGSGSVGGSNVGQQLGMGWLVAVGVFDVAKGALPVALCRLATIDPAAPIVAGLAVMVGHNWSAYLGLRGGRGVGVTVGATAVWDWRLTVLFLAILAVGWALRRAPEATLMGYLALAPGALGLGAGTAVAGGCAGLAALAIAKRLEANRLPLPASGPERRQVFRRRLLMDRDVPRGEPWQERSSVA